MLTVLILKKVLNGFEYKHRRGDKSMMLVEKDN